MLRHVFQSWRFKTLKETMREYIVMGIHSFDSSKDIFNPGFVFPDVDSGFLQDKNVEFDGDLSKINDWIQEVFEKDLARNFPPKVSACGARIVCQKCKIDMNEIFKSSKKHACELELVKD